VSPQIEIVTYNFEIKKEIHKYKPG
jgi:hypothetical protein